jgi:BirA family biotin operon repressor/biotin-[acetyl-CoA-carboxylase] ligase
VEEVRSFHFDELDSTQNEALRLLDSQVQPPFIVTASKQTAGRGRQSRTWHMEPGRSLAMSLVVRLSVENLEGLSLVVGLGILEAIPTIPLQLKWPNDLMLNNQKVGGVLVESRSQGSTADVVIGIGLNLFGQQEAAYAGLGTKVEAHVVAQKVYSMIERCGRESFKALRSLYESKMWRKNQEIELLVNQEKLIVRLEGVGDRGELKTNQQGRLVLSVDGEIRHE